MTVTDISSPWLLLVFSLPSQRASQRVEVWRKLQRIGALPLRSAGYVLPNTPANRERLEWLAASIRSYKGQASVVRAQEFDDLPDARLRQMFVDARSRDYASLLREVKKTMALPPGRRPAGRLSRSRRRLQELVAIDFFDNPQRGRVESLLARAEAPPSSPLRGKGKRGTYQNRTWITRSRPGIDRVSSAWLICRFIDPKARFVFGDATGTHAEAVPFDMFASEGFGHRGEDCTFETLRKEFAIADAKVKRIAQIIHDADLEDDKFGHVEGAGLDRVLKGWAEQDVEDEELLRRGMELIEGLYHGL